MLYTPRLPDAPLGSNSDLQDIILVSKLKHSNFNSSLQAINPFTWNHTDWMSEQNSSANVREARELNLEVLGIVSLAGKTKAVLRDLNEPAARSFWLGKGDYYNGFEVIYVDSSYIVFQGEEKNIRFSLKSSQGKLYKGRGEIFIAPDIDLYLEELKKEIIAENATNATNGTEPSNSTQFDFQSDLLQNRDRGGGGSADGSNQAGKSSGSGSGVGSEDALTNEQELEFIQDVLNLLQN